MLDRLMGTLIQEVPMELSVCEFECPVTTCTVSNWVTCTLWRCTPQQRGILSPPANAEIIRI